MQSCVSFCVIVVISELLKHDHVLANQRLMVAPYYECLGIVPPGMGDVPCWTPLPVTVNFNPRVVQFVAVNDAICSHIEASLSDLSPGCTVTWPDSVAPDSGTVEVTFAGTNSDVSGVTTSNACRDRLTELLGMIEVGSIDVLQEIWPSFVEQLDKQWLQADKSVSVQIDSDKSCVHVVGERDKYRQMMGKLSDLNSHLVEKLRSSKMQISECLSNIFPHQLSLLQTCGFLQVDSADDIMVNTVDNALVLKGQPIKVRDWKMKIYEKLVMAQSETVHLDEYILNMLKQEPFSQHLDQLLHSITGVVWYTAGKQIEVYGESQDKVSCLIYVDTFCSSLLDWV